MTFFCSCRICKINSKSGNGRVLSTKKTFKKHQKKKKASIEEINEIEISEIESNNELFSSTLSYNITEKRKFKNDELGESDINSANSSSDNDASFSIPLILEDDS